MTVVFYIAGAVAVISTLLVVTRRNTIHALLYLVVSLFAVAVVFYTLGAPFVAALEVIVYAGAIVVLFLFTVMLLNLGREAEAEERRRLRPASWIGPGILAAVLLVELGVAIASGATAQVGARAVEPREVGVALYGPYAIGVELASTLLLAALIGARHLGQRQRELDADALAAAAAAGPDGPRPDAGGPGGGGPAGAPGEGPPTREEGLTEPAAAAAEPTPAPRSVRFWRKDDD
ncbi:MAG: NADH-quinone oxidoreductase subunit J [Thermoleophilia bacterium]